MCSVAIRISVPRPRPCMGRPSHDPVSNVRLTGNPAAIRLVLPTTVPDSIAANWRFHDSGRVSDRVPQ